MKKIALIVALFICYIGCYANDTFRKEKKAITEFIKNEYHSWTITNSDEYQSTNAFQVNSTSPEFTAQVNEPKQINARLKKYNELTTYEFKDFEFTIVNNQAIVQFSVDQKFVSAFLEKEGGKWKLICAANLDQSI